MYDTVVASIELNKPLDETIFQEGQTTTNLRGESMLRLWYNPEKYGPRLTYWRKVGEQRVRLRAEFSIPHLLNVSPYANPSQSQTLRAITDVSAYVNMLFSAELPHFRTWRVSRMDYAVNWDVGDKLPQYLSMLQALRPGNMTRHPYPDSGVVFKSKQRNGRAVKFYDKGREQGELNRHVLRYEVSNFKRVIPYMTERWYGCTRSVDDLLHPGRALFCMAVMWERLGLSHAREYGGETSLLLRLRDTFGSAAPGAYYALMCIRAYGKDCVDMGLMSSNTYYTRKRELSQHNYMIDTQYHLPALHLPCHILEQQEDFAAAQDLGTGAAAPAKRKEKILREKLGVKAGVAIPKYLLRSVSDARTAA